MAPLLLKLAAVLLCAKLGGDLATRLKQPAVLGELGAGVLLGNLELLGVHWLSGWKHDAQLELLAQLGILLLLFEVGLQSTVKQMRQVGWPSLVVASLGVLAPFALGYLVTAQLLPEAGPYVHAFLGATLCATSVGITARVLKDLGQLQTPVARVILGAAVIDDVLGLVLLAVVSGAIAAAGAGGGLHLTQVLLVLGKAVGFLLGALWLGVRLSRRLFDLASRLQSRGVLLAVGLSFCFLLSYLADRIGLAPIVGAFAAGLLLEDVHSQGFVDKGEHPLEELVRPITSFLVPVFFVLMGMRTDLGAFAHKGVLALAAALCAVAIAGKLACALGVWQKGLDRLSIGIGMIPRGEVGLIFASIGTQLSIGGQPVITGATYSATVIMVIVTTLVTPPALKWSLSRRGPP